MLSQWRFQADSEPFAPAVNAKTGIKCYGLLFLITKDYSK